MPQLRCAQSRRPLTGNVGRQGKGLQYDAIGSQTSLTDPVNASTFWFLVMCAIALAATSPAAQSQAGSESALPRIAVFSSSPPPPADEGLREGLRELGYVEGKSINIDWRRSLGSEEELRSVATQVARRHVLLIV